MKEEEQKYHFILRDTECGSKIFGDCEICNKPVVQVFHQKRYKLKTHPLKNVPYMQFISDSYGHKQCLEDKR